VCAQKEGTSGINYLLGIICNTSEGRAGKKILFTVEKKAK